MIASRVTQNNILDKFISQRAKQCGGSAIASIGRLAKEYKAIDLAFGAPEFSTPTALKQAAVGAIDDNINQYAPLWGIGQLREAIAKKINSSMNVTVDPDREVTVTCGATEAMQNVMMTIIEPGDEIVVFAPFYENHVAAARFHGAIVRYVPLHPTAWSFDRQVLEAAFSDRTKAIVLNTPNNPTGKVFTREELQEIADLCLKWQVLCVTDEIYEHIVFDGRQHLSMLQIEEMRSQVIVVNSLSKSYHVTGWRIGYAIAPPEITDVLRDLHEITTAGAPAPLQIAGVAALQLPDSYYQSFREEIQQKRDRLLQILTGLGFVCYQPQGAYYIMADIGSFGFISDKEFATFLIKEIGVAAVPGSIFYSKEYQQNNLVRFCFCKLDSTIDAAELRLSRLVA